MKTFFIPVSEGKFEAPLSVHVHGLFAFAWVILFLVQNAFIHLQKYILHRWFGWAGLVIAAGVAVTLIPVAMYTVDRDLVSLGGIAYSSLLGSITSGLLFLFFVGLGVWRRNDRESHKRFMLLATIVVLWPAWFRFRHYFPGVPHPEIWFALVLADSLIVVSWIWDKFKNGSVHRVLLYWGSFTIVEQTFEVMMFDHPTWRFIATSLYHVLK